MHHTRSGLILAYHGCDKSVADKVIKNNGSLKKSSNDYDWLGHGIYFWENSYSRALDYAKELKASGRSTSINKPAVIGAVLDLGHCLNLLDYENLNLVKKAYSALKVVTEASTSSLPENKGGTDLLKRHLDCAVLEFLHKIREGIDLHDFDSVRGMFTEGKELYPNAGFKAKNHIQLCIRNPNCIKGYFNPLEPNNNFPLV